MDERSDEYEVGYGKPPKSTRFKKGQSGNPKGRPKASRNVAAALEEALFRKIRVKDQSGSRLVTVLEALLQRVSKQALDGDHRAIGKLIELIRYFDAMKARDACDGRASAEEPRPLPVGESDLEILRHLAGALEAGEFDPEDEDAEQ